MYSNKAKRFFSVNSGNCDSETGKRKRRNSNVNLVLSSYQREVLIGLILGDVSLEKATSNSNVRVRFDQSFNVHSEYLMFLYEI